MTINPKISKYPLANQPIDCNRSWLANRRSYIVYPISRSLCTIVGDGLTSIKLFSISFKDLKVAQRDLNYTNVEMRAQQLRLDLKLINFKFFTKTKSIFQLFPCREALSVSRHPHNPAAAILIKT